MGLVEIFLIGIGLSMDAFAVAICKGLSMKRIDVGYAFLLACFFGGFQALMPVCGWVLGTQFEHFITSIDHWIAFVLLAFIGGNMIWEARKADDCSATDAGDADGASEASGAQGTSSVQGASGVQGMRGVSGSTSTSDVLGAQGAQGALRMRGKLGELFALALATSIDALAVGVTFAFLGVNIVRAALLIGSTTFVLSLGGVVVGNRFGSRYQRAASIVGGVVLVCIGVKILLEHLGLLSLG